VIFIQNAAQQAPKISQTTVLGILVASTLIVLGLLGLIAIFAWKRRVVSVNFCNLMAR
jgi:uncharacterized protein YybS (DUF2232 family)